MKRHVCRLATLALAFLASAVPAAAQDGGHTGQSFLLPPRASSDYIPVRIDELFYLILYITLAAMVGVFVALAYFLWKYRYRPGRKGKFVHGNHTIELVWTIVPAAILVWLGITQADDWLKMKVPDRFPKAADSTVVEVVAQQFDWNFRHPGVDGKFETYDKKKAEAALVAAKSDPAVLAEFDPEADDYFGAEDDDDVVGASLVVPVNKPVLIELRSVDVIHSLYIPVFRFKQDAVPGKPMPLWFWPTQIGEFEIACAELCGNNHTTMRAWIKVVSQEEFDNGLKSESPNKIVWRGLKAESERKQGGIDRYSDNQWRHWYKSGLPTGVRQDLHKPWNDVKIALQEARSPKQG